MKIFVISNVLMMLVLWGCATKIPRNALDLPPELLVNRQMQTRVFDTVNVKTMLSAAAGVMQDLGFVIEETELSLGVLVGSKRRDATNSRQVSGAVVMALLTGVAMEVDKEQVIRLSMVMRELPGEPGAMAASGRSTVRVTMQRSVFNTAGKITTAEQINDPEIYRDFFEKLSQSVFLEAHEI